MFCATMTPEIGAYTFTMGLGWSLSTPKSLQLLFGRSQVGLGVFLRILGLLQHRLRDGAVLIQILCAQVCLVGQLLVVAAAFR